MKRGGPIPRGFTLIEIMMVVAIMGLILTLGFPAFLKTINREGMRKAEYDLVEACVQARRQAILGNQMTPLVWHPMLGTFSVPGAFPETQLPSGVSIEILGVNFIQYERSDLAEVHFFANGTSDEFTIVLRSAQSSPVKISLDTVTALPNVEDIR